jgi:hypothetical protein
MFEMRQAFPRLRFSGRVAIVSSLAAIALVLAGVMNFAPIRPHKTLPILRAASAGVLRESRSSYYDPVRSNLLTRSSRVDSNKVAVWNFSRGVPDGWRVTAGTDVHTVGQGATTVRTTPKNFDRQLRSNAVSLGPGYYDIVVEGAVSEGGVVLGAERGSVCLGNSFFSADQWRENHGGTLMTRRLALPSRASVRVVISNWSQPDAPSVWRIKRVFVRRLSFPELPPVRARFARPATPLVSRSDATANTAGIRMWSFTHRIPKSWKPQEATLAIDDGGTKIRTASSKYAYALSSVPLRLDKGSYSVILDNRIARGGLQLAITTLSKHEDREVPIAINSFWFGQDFSRGFAVAKFSIDVPGTVRIILANWNPYNLPSQWFLRHVYLVAKLTS